MSAPARPFDLDAILHSIPFWKIFFVLAAVDLVSFSGHIFPEINQTMFAIIVFATLLISLRSLTIGLFIVFAELVVGSKGYLFSWPIGSFDVSIRLGLFVVIFLGFLWSLRRERRMLFFEWPWSRGLLLFAVLLVVGITLGIANNHSGKNIFLDANGYLYLALLLPLIQAIRRPEDHQRLIGVMIVATVFLLAKGLVLLFLFSHLSAFRYVLPEVYRWVRLSGLGEITTYSNGFVRVFFQSHLYVLILFLLSGLSLLFPRSRPSRLWKGTVGGLFAVSLLSLFLSYSRSFWVSALVMIFGTLVVLAVKKVISLKRAAVAIGLLGLTFALDLAVALAIVNFPLGDRAGVSLGSLVKDRATETEEPAIGSRMQLLKPLAFKALEQPILGSGLGATVTYKTENPAYLERHPDGLYTTFAFEWGYLDFLLKFGFLGLFGIAAGLGFLLLRAWNHARTSAAHPAFAWGWFVTIAAISVVHIFTPYLNHPLGLGWLMIAMLGLQEPLLRKTL